MPIFVLFYSSKLIRIHSFENRFSIQTAIGYTANEIRAQVNKIIITFHFHVFLIVMCPFPKKNGAVVAADGTRDAKLAMIQMITVIPTVECPAAAKIGITKL